MFECARTPDLRLSGVVALLQDIAPDHRFYSMRKLVRNNAGHLICSPGNCVIDLFGVRAATTEASNLATAWLRAAQKALSDASHRGSSL